MSADPISSDFGFRSPVSKLSQGKGKIDVAYWLAKDRFCGIPAQRKWLVDGIIPLSQPSMLASAGGVGKSYLLLKLAREVSADNPTTFLGGVVATGGSAVYIAAEDDKIEVHNRLSSLGSVPDNLYVIPLPDAGGVAPLFAPDPKTRQPVTTMAWIDLVEQLGAMPRLKLVVLDPLQTLCTLDLNMPEHGQFVCSHLASLATKTGAAVIVSHHFAKRAVSTSDQARDAIRGTSGLVDGMRSVYALWSKRDVKTKRGDASGEIIMGCVVKANGRANRKISHFSREEHGLLQELDFSQSDEAKILARQNLDLIESIANAAKTGRPFTKTGTNGVYARRRELPESLQSIGKHRFEKKIGDMLNRLELVSEIIPGAGSVKWLDKPDGVVARNTVSLDDEHKKRSRPGMK